MENRRVHEVIHSLRAKPEHIRERIALGVAGGTTLLVALGWFGVMSTTGAFSLKSTNVIAEDAGSKIPTTVAETKNGFSQLLGAASVAVGATTSAPAITVVDTKSYSTLDEQTPDANQTVIHF
jgi:hypothetical protein